MSWKEDDLPPGQKETCFWLEAHGIDPRKVPLDGVTLSKDRSEATVQTYYIGPGKNYRIEVDPETGDIRMADPITFAVTVPPSNEVRKFIKNPHQIREEWFEERNK